MLRFARASRVVLVQDLFDNYKTSIDEDERLLDIYNVPRHEPSSVEGQRVMFSRCD
jgi:hypothetical protein